MGAYYRPYFFRFSLPFIVDKDISKYESQNLARFVHEYIHFLQNLYTPWGLFTSFQSYARITRALEEIRHNPEQDIHIPFKGKVSDHDKWFSKVYTEGEGKRFSENNNDIDNVAFKPTTLIKFRRVKKDGGKPVVILDVDTVPYGKQEIILGAWIIKESMAQIIQTSIFADDNEDVRPKVVPYDVVSILCDQYAPSVRNDPSKQVAICWGALFSMSPGEALIDLLDFAERNPELSASEIFEYHITTSRIKIKSVERTVSFEDFMLDIRKRFLQHLDAFLGMSCNYFKNILSDRSIQNVLSLILKFIGNNDPVKIDSVINDLGMPVVFGESNSSCIPFLEEEPESMLPLMKLFGAELVYSFLNSKSCRCPLIEMCENDPTIEIQYDCISNPLMIEIDCPMHFASQIMGVHGRNIDMEE